MRRLISTRNLLAFVILSLSGFLVLWVLQNYETGSDGEIVELVSPQVDLALKGFSYTETLAGRQKWTLKGDRATHDIASDATRVADVDMVFYDDELGPISLKAREGVIDGKHQVVDIAGEVVLESLEKYTIYTDSLQFRVKEKLIETADPVRISSDGAELYGRGLRFDLGTRVLELLSSVKATFSSQGNNH